jgi:hypothetical protein
MSIYKYVFLYIGFECESLSPSTFRELLRRIFNMNLKNAEIGFLVKKFDTKKTGIHSFIHVYKKVMIFVHVCVFRYVCLCICIY